MSPLLRAGLLPALCAVGVFGLVGCTSNDTVRTNQSTTGGMVGQEGPTDLSPKSPKPLPEHGMEGMNASGMTGNMTPGAGSGQNLSPSTGGMTHSVFAFPSGDPATAVALLDKSLPSQVAVGQPFDITYTLTNKSPTLCLEEGVVSDTLPAGFKINSTTPNATSNEGGVVRWNVGRLDPGQSASFKLNGTATQPGNLQSCAALTGIPRACSTIAVVAPALKLAKTITPTPLICDPIQATYTVTNSGTGNATNVVINDTLPEGLTTTDGKSTLSIPVGVLGPNQSRAFSANLKAARTGTFNSTATASADAGLKSDAGAGTTVSSPILQVACAGTPKTFIGRQFTHEFTVTNTGDAPARNATLTVTTPAGATVASSSTGGTAGTGRVTFTLPEIAPKANTKATITYTAGAEGTFTSNVAVTGTCVGPQAITCSTGTSVTGIPALLLNGSDAPDPVQVGQTVTYTLTVTNQGSAPLTNVKLVGTAEPATMQIVSSTGGTATMDGAKITFAPIATLAPKAQQTYTVVVKALKAGQVQFSAESSSNEITRPLVKTETTNFYE